MGELHEMVVDAVKASIENVVGHIAMGKEEAESSVEMWVGCEIPGKDIKIKMAVTAMLVDEEKE